MSNKLSSIIKSSILSVAILLTGGAWAATPVAEWTDFRNLTSGNYTWSTNSNSGCSVDANGVLTIGSSGGVYMDISSIGSDTRSFSIAIEADIPGTYTSDKTLVDLIVNGAHVSVVANGTTIGQCWNTGAVGNYGSGSFTAGRQLLIVTFQGASGQGTHSYINGTQIAAATGLMSSSGSVTHIGIGSYNKTGEVAENLKIYSIRLYNSKLSADDVSTDKTLFYPDANRYLTLSGGTTQWSEASWTTAAPGASDFAKVNVTDDSILNLDDSATAVKMSDFYVAAGKTLTLTGDFTKAGKVKFTGPGKVANWNTINLNIAADSNSLTTSEKVGMSGVGVTGTLWDNLGVSSGNHTSGNFNFGKVVDASSANSLDYRFGVAYSGTRGAWYTSLGSSDNLRHGYLDDQNASGKNTPTISLFGVPFDKYRVVVYHSTDSENYQFGYDTVNGDDLYYDSNLVLQSGTTAWGSSGPNNSAHPIAEGTNTLVSGVYTAPTLTVVGHRPSSGNVRGCIAAVQVVKVEEVTISTVDTYTLAGLFGSVGVNSDFIINVNEDATLNIPASTTLGAIEFNVASGKTLTLTGNTLTASRCITVKGSGMVATSVMNVLAGTIKGNGTLCYDMNDGITQPTGLTCTKAAWTGVLWIKNSAYTGWLFKDYGSTASTVRIENVTCYLNDSETLNSTLDLVGEGLKITNGNGYTVETVKKLTGSGTLTLSGGSANGNGFVIQDASEFYGTIQNTSPAGGSRRYKVTIGGSGTYGYERNMVIANGYTGTIANGKTWTMPGGFEVSGTLAFAGTGTASGPVTTFSGSTLDLSGFTGTAPAISGSLTLASGTTIKLPSGAEFPYQIASSGSATVENVTVVIDGGDTTTGTVKLVDGALSGIKTATLDSAGSATFSTIGWAGFGTEYNLTISADTTLTLDDLSDVGYLNITVSNSAKLSIVGEFTCDYEIEGLSNFTIADSDVRHFTASAAAECYQQIGTSANASGAISSSGTSIVIDNASSLTSEGYYPLACWVTPQIMSTGYGRVATLTTTGLPEGMSAELVYGAKAIYLRVYNATTYNARPKLKIWPYGDSITEGFNLGDSKANYRVLLGQKLAMRGYNVEMVGCYDKIQSRYGTDSFFDAIDPSGATIPDAWKWHSAKHGATLGVTSLTSWQRSALLENVDALTAQVDTPDVVLLLGGINDLSPGFDAPATVFANWTNVVTRLVNNLPNAKIIVTTTLHAGPGRTDSLNTNADGFNTLVKNYLNNDKPTAWNDHVYFVDLCDKVKSAKTGVISTDNLHPDWLGDDQMAEGWLDKILELYPENNPADESEYAFPSKARAAVVSPEPPLAKTYLDGYTNGFTRCRTITAVAGIDTANPYTSSGAGITENIGKVGYFVEYVRSDNGATHWLWVDMDAFGDFNLDSVGLPSANHQQEVTSLHVISSHKGIETVAANDDSVTGWIEFTPFTYAGTSSGVTGAPAAHGNGSMFDWNDTLGSSGTEGCMQVFRKAPSTGRPAQVLFAYNNWNQNSTEAEFGIGNCAQHFWGGAQTLDYTNTRGLSKLNASAYSVKTIEIWTKPPAESPEYDDFTFSNNGEGDNPAASGNQGNFTKDNDTWTISIPASTTLAAGTLVRLDAVSIGIGSSHDLNVKYVKVTGEQGTVWSDIANGTGEKNTTAETSGDTLSYKQTYRFMADCFLTVGKSYALEFVGANGETVTQGMRLVNATSGATATIAQSSSLAGAWRPNQEVKVRKVHTATIAADADLATLVATAANFTPALPTDSAGSFLRFNVTANAEFAVAAGGATVGGVSFYVDEGKILTLTGGTLTGTSHIGVYGGTVKVTAAAALVGTVAGDGTAKYEGAMPGTSANAAVSTDFKDYTPKGEFTNRAWTGTVWIYNYSGPDLYPHYWCNSGSKVKFTKVSGYLPGKGNTGYWLMHYDGSTVGELILEDDGGNAAFTRTDGFSHSATGDNTDGNSYFAFAKISGTGKLTDNRNNNQSVYYVFNDAESFEGTFSFSKGTTVIIGDSSPLNSTDYDGKIVIDTGKAATVAAGKTWTANNGVVVNGTLTLGGTGSTISGTVKGSGTIVCNQIDLSGSGFSDASGWTGTVQIAGDTTSPTTSFDETAYGNASSALEIASGHVKVTAATSLPGTVNVASGATLYMTSSSLTELSISGTNSGTIDLSGASNLTSLTLSEGIVSGTVVYPSSLTTLNVAWTESLTEDGRRAFTCTGATLVGGTLTLTRPDGTTENVTGAVDGATVSFSWAPTVKGAACWVDYEMDYESGVKTGWENSGTDTTDLHKDSDTNSVNIEGDDAFYNGMLYTYAHPYRDDLGTLPENWTAVVRCTVPNYENAVVITFGWHDSMIGLVAGANPETQMKLIRTTSDSQFETLATMTVQDATTAQHVYIFSVETNQTIKVYCDGQNVLDRTFDSAFTITRGFQVGSALGGVGSTGVVRFGKGESPANTLSETVQKDARIDCVRLFRGVLGPNAIRQLSVEFPAVKLYRATVAADADTDWDSLSWTPEWDGGNEYSKIILTAAGNATLTLPSTITAEDFKIDVASGHVLTLNKADGGTTFTTTNPMEVDNGTMCLANETSLGTWEIAGTGTVRLPNGAVVTGALSGTAKVEIPSDATVGVVGGSIANTITGAGVLAYPMALPASALSFSSWTGTVQLPAITDGGIVFSNYGVAGSTVYLTSMSGAWIDPDNTTIAPKLYLAGNMTLAAMSTRTYTFAEIDGPGNLSFATSEGEPTVSITKVAEGYSGAISSTFSNPVTITTLAREAGTSTASGTKLLSKSGTVVVAGNGTVTIGGAEQDMTLYYADDGVYVDGKVSSEGEGSSEVRTIATDTTTTAVTVALGDDYEGSLVVPPNVASVATTGTSLDTSKVAVKYGATDITGAFTIGSSAGAITLALDPDGEVTFNEGGADEKTVSVKPAVDTSDDPMAMPDETTAPAFNIKTIPGLWYVVRSGTSPSSLTAGAATQATTTTTELEGATMGDATVKYYKISVGTTAAEAAE